MSDSTEGRAGSPFRQAVSTSAEDRDAQGRLRPRALLALLQEAAGRDATHRGAGMARLLEDGLAWMLVRLVVEVDRWPDASEECFLSTWPTSFGGASAERAFRLEGGARTAAGSPLVAEATSLWAVVDLQARRAVRVPAFLRALPTAHEEVSVRLPAARERLPNGPLLGECAVEVERTDLDQVGHANNTHYLDWALQALPPGFEDGREIAHLDLAFRREARLGDRLQSRAYTLGGDHIAHQITASTQDLCALVQTRWRTRPDQRGGRVQEAKARRPASVPR